MDFPAIPVSYPVQWGTWVQPPEYLANLNIRTCSCTCTCMYIRTFTLKTAVLSEVDDFVTFWKVEVFA